MNRGFFFRAYRFLLRMGGNSLSRFLLRFRRALRGNFRFRRLFVYLDRLLRGLLSLRPGLPDNLGFFFVFLIH